MLSEGSVKPAHHLKNVNHFCQFGGAAAAAAYQNRPFCAGCRQPITDQFYYAAVDKLWHDRCLTCCQCSGRLCEKGSLFTRNDMMLCKNDYLKLFGAKGQCAGCQRTIDGNELVMRAKQLVFHSACFVCSVCLQRPTAGQKVYLCGEVQLVCESDFASRSLASNDSLLYGSHNLLNFGGVRSSSQPRIC